MKPEVIFAVRALYRLISAVFPKWIPKELKASPDDIRRRNKIPAECPLAKPDQSGQVDENPPGI